MDKKQLKEVLRKHQLWLDGKSGGEEADLSEEDLRGANLAGANLQQAALEFVDLRGANLAGADLRKVYFEKAAFREADLREADLTEAYLLGADLRGADLSRARLDKTELKQARLEGANLKGTCLDPEAPVPVPSVEEIENAGLELKGDKVWGWRTSFSVTCGNTKYIPGEVYEAPVFSVDTKTDCHPGIYLASKDWLKKNYFYGLVRCYALRKELVHAGDKWRAKRIWVVAAEEAD